MFLVCSVAEMQGGSFLQVDVTVLKMSRQAYFVFFFFLPSTIYFPFRHQSRSLFDLMCSAAPVCSQLSPDVLHFEKSSPEF